MPARASWKGYLKLSLVSCAVQLFPATTSKDRVSFHLLSRETGHRLRRQMIDPETAKAVEAEDQVKGYEVGKNEYVLVEDDEIDDVAIESSHTIDIESFVPRQEIDEVFLDTPYYLAPDGAMAEEAFAVIREAMADKKVCGIGRVVLYRRERPILLEPRGKGLVATTLRYAYEIRSDEEAFEDIGETKVPEEMLDLATHIIGRKMAHFDPKAFEDRYQDALLALIEAKRNHAPVKSAPVSKASGNVVSLMDALRKSLADQGGGVARRGSPKAKAGDKGPGSAAKASQSGTTESASARKSQTGGRRAASRPGRLKRAG